MRRKTLADISATGPAGYQTLARLRLAAVQWNLSQTKQALATWQSVADDGAAPQMLRDLATLTSAQHQVDSAEPAVLKQSTGDADRAPVITGPLWLNR